MRHNPKHSKKQERRLPDIVRIVCVQALIELVKSGIAAL